MKRRDFIKSTALIGSAAFIHPNDVFSRLSAVSSYFSLHPFIEVHPEAVFIRTTSVDNKINSAQKLQTGSDFAKEIFILSDQPGIPLDQTMAIKPNLTCTFGTGTTAEGIGIQTDHDFVEGMIQGMREVGFESQRMYLREGNWLGDGYCANEITINLMHQMALRQGFHILDFPTGRSLPDITFDTIVDGEEVVWKDCPNGVIFKRIGYVAPYNSDQSWLLNIAKFKTHSMGMTLAVKNMQGMCISPYVRFCEGVDGTKKHPAKVLNDFQPDFEARIDSLYDRHTKESIPRWDRPGRDSYGGYGMETWAQRTCDSHTVNRAGLSIIEGIYGRNGDGFNAGPGLDGKPEDFMSNVLIFGKNPFLVDIIGTWLAGHEPGNFGLFHIAKERGLCDTINPESIPVYEWHNDAPVLTPLQSIQRTPLVCPYLRKDYNGGTEAQYHLVNEPYDYSGTSLPPIHAPSAFVLGQNYSNPFALQTIIEYSLPQEGAVMLDIYNAAGERIDVIAEGRKQRGTHMAVWNAGNYPSGTYFYKLHTQSGVLTRKMVIMK